MAQEREVDFGSYSNIFVPESIYMRRELNSGGVCLSSMNGLVLTRAQVEQLLEDALKFIDYVGDETIDENNEMSLQKSSMPDCSKKSDLQKKDGWVYVVKIQNDDLYKIGMTTKTPDERLAQFVPKMPYEASLLCSSRCLYPNDVEKYLHELYADKHENGEWFRLDQNDLAEIVRHLELISIEDVR